MKKGAFIFSTLTLLSFPGLAQAKQNICVDSIYWVKLVSPNKLIEEWGSSQ